MSRKLRSALLDAIQRDEDLEREQEQELLAAQDRQDQQRRDDYERRQAQALERLAEAFSDIARSLNKISALGVDLNKRW